MSDSEAKGGSVGDEELEEGELSSEDEAAVLPPQPPQIPPLFEKKAVEEKPKKEEKDDLETFMRKKAEEMQARAFSHLGPTATSPDRRSPAAFPDPPRPPPVVAAPSLPEPTFSRSPEPPAPFGGADKDYRAKDQDYRYSRSPNAAFPTGPSSSNHFGDQDYRQAPEHHRRRRYSDEPEEAEPKRRRRESPPSGRHDDGRQVRDGAPLLPPPPMAPSLSANMEEPQCPPPSRSSRRRQEGGNRKGRLNKWGKPSICKFYREGYCRDGLGCTYSHDAVDACRKAELCKFYQQGFCKKSLVCPFLHGEWPCKAFHKGECSKGDDCAFSHMRLDDFTQPIFDQMLRDEELASNIKIPTTATKRKTLLPMPLQPPGLPAATEVADVPAAVAAVPSTSTAHTSRFDRTEHPNATKAPSLLSLPTQTAPPIPPSLPDPTGGRLALGFFGVANQQAPHPPIPPNGAPPPGLALPPPGLIVPPMPIQQPHAGGLLPTPDATMDANVPNHIGSVNAGPEPSLPSNDAGFNISEMLRKIKASVGGGANPIPDTPTEPVDESPASPPMDGASRGPRVKQISLNGYRLVICDVYSRPCDVGQFLLNASLSDAKLGNDPRIKKALSAQFGSNTSALIADAKAASAKTSPVASSAASRRDPRAAARDPRKKAAAPAPSDAQPNYEEMVAMQLKMTAALAQGGDTTTGGFGGPMLPSSAPMDDLPANFMATPVTAASSQPDPSPTQGGWMPSLSSSSGPASLDLPGGLDSELAGNLGLPFSTPDSSAQRYGALSGIKVRKLKSEG